jgi:amino acid transporter
MSMTHILKLFGSSQEGWNDLVRIHPSVFRLAAFLVLPLSLIPPLMLEYAGRHTVGGLFPQVSSAAWSFAALAFLLAEWLTVPLIAWGIRSVASSRGTACRYHDAFTLAAIAPIPMWLSALVLFAGNTAAILAVAIAGLAASVVLIFRGVEGILKVEEDVVAAQIAYVVTAMGLIAWVLLIMLGLVPTMGHF